MKKLIISILVLAGFCTVASAGVGVKVGVSAQIGSMETSGKEVSSDGTTQTAATEEALFGTGGYFIEKDLAFLPSRLGVIGSRIHIGYDTIAHDLDLGTQTNVRVDPVLKGVGEQTENEDYSLNAKVTGFETIYATINITDWLYVKAGEVTVDVKTKFSGSTTSSYPENHSLDGTMVGFGVAKTSDSGLFFRLEYNDYSIDGKSVVNAGAGSKFTSTLNDVSGSTGRISIGKAF